MKKLIYILFCYIALSGSKADFKTHQDQKTNIKDKKIENN